MIKTRLLSLLIICAAMLGVAHAEVIYGATAYSHDGITINASKIYLKKGKIWFKLLVINGTDRVLYIDKNQIQAKLPDGRVLSRETGTFGGRAKPHEVPPGLSHAFDVEYKIGDLPLEVRLKLEHGFILGGKPIARPDFVAGPIR